MVFVLDTGTMGHNEQLLEAVFGTMKSRQGSDCHVATSPRRDVISKICTPSFKVRLAQKLGYREAYERRHGFPEQSDTVFEEVPGICTAFHVFDIFRC